MSNDTGDEARKDLYDKLKRQPGEDSLSHLERVSYCQNCGMRTQLDGDGTWGHSRYPMDHEPNPTPEYREQEETAFREYNENASPEDGLQGVSWRLAEAVGGSKNVINIKKPEDK